MKTNSTFPMFETYKKDSGSDLVYFDNASTTPVPSEVLIAHDYYYRKYGVSLSRGGIALGSKLNEAVETIKNSVQKFLNTDSHDVIFTSGATDSVNRLIRAITDQFDNPLIVTTIREHSSTLSPLLMLEKIGKCRVRILSEEQLQTENIIDKLNNESVTAFFCQHTNNVTGTHINIEAVAQVCINKNILLFVDYSQSVGKLPILLPENVSAAYFSAHKMFGTKGVGVTLINKSVVNTLTPGVYGGGSVKSVSVKGAVLLDGIASFEPGTGNYGGIFALGRAIEYLEHIGLENIKSDIHDITSYLYNKLLQIPEVTVVSDKNSLGIVSCTISGIHPHDVEAFLSGKHIFIRTGFHCAEMWTRACSNNIPVVRFSLHYYNTRNEIDALIENLIKIITISKQ